MDKFGKEGSKIAELIEKGREQGYLTYADVNDHLPEDISEPEQFEEIIGMIEDLGLTVHEKAPDVDTLMLRESENTDDIALEQAGRAQLKMRQAELLIPCACTCVRWERLIC